MRRKFLLRKLSNMTGVSQTKCNKVFNALGEVIYEEMLNGNYFIIPNVGAFTIKETKDRYAADINNPGQLRLLKGHPVPQFKFTQEFKNLFITMEHFTDPEE